MRYITDLPEKGKTLKAKEDNEKEDLFDLGMKENDPTPQKGKLQEKGGRRYLQCVIRQVKGWYLQEKDGIPSRNRDKENEQECTK